MFKNVFINTCKKSDDRSWLQTHSSHKGIFKYLNIEQNSLILFPPLVLLLFVCWENVHGCLTERKSLVPFPECIERANVWMCLMEEYLNFWWKYEIILHTRNARRRRNMIFPFREFIIYEHVFLCVNVTVADQNFGQIRNHESHFLWFAQGLLEKYELENNEPVLRNICATINNVS